VGAFVVEDLDKFLEARLLLKRAVVVDAEVNKEPGRPLFGVNGEVRSKKI
jgi:hypothetical protein